MATEELTDSTSGDSVTQWVNRLQKGDAAAAALLWERFFTGLTHLARQRLGGRPRAMADEEDIALSAFNSFCAGLQQGRFAELHSRDNLWRLLIVITSRKAADEIAFQHRDKRDASRLEAMDDEAIVSQVISREPTPEIAAEFSDQLRSLLESLEHEDLKQIALLKMEGYTNSEISQQLSRSITTVERKLRTIRSIWSQLDE